MTTILEIRAKHAATESVPPMPTILAPDGRMMWCPGDTILTLDEVAAILSMKDPKTLRRMHGLRIAYATPQRPFVLYRWLVEYLESKAA